MKHFPTSSVPSQWLWIRLLLGGPNGAHVRPEGGPANRTLRAAPEEHGLHFVWYVCLSLFLSVWLIDIGYGSSLSRLDF